MTAAGALAISDRSNMSVAFGDLTLTLPPGQFDALVDAVAARVLAELPDGERTGWLDVPQAARYIGYDESTLQRGKRRLYDWVAQGRVDYRKDGSRLLFRYEWLDAAVNREMQ